MYSIKDNVLTLENGRTVTFAYNISHVLYGDAYYLVTISPSDHSTFLDNVYGVTDQGEIVWRIESINGIPEYWANAYVSCYIPLEIEDNNIAAAATAFENAVYFDIRTGHIVKTVTGERSGSS